MAGGLANSLLTISMITREALRVLENSLTFTKQISRTYDDKFAIAGAKIGTVLNIRKPPRYAGRIGQALALEDSVETSVPLVLTTQRGVDIVFTSQELTLSVDDFGRRFLRPAILGIANRIDLDGAALVTGAPPAGGVQQQLGVGVTVSPAPTPGVYNTVGTIGTLPNTALLYLQAGQRLNEEACPVEDRVIVMPPSFIPPIVDALKGLFQSAERIAEQYERGMMGIGLGFRWYMDQNMPVNLSGTATTAAVGAAGQTGPVLAITALSGTLNQGDVITIAGVHAVNPMSQMDTGALREFVVTANVASGATSIPIYPALQLSGLQTGGVPYGTVYTLPAGGAVITPVFGASATVRNACAFHPEAFCMASADLLLPGGVDMAARVADDQLGFSIRAIRAYDINLDRFPTRLDILYGFGTLYQEMACRIVA
jgi:hypothetical protein